MPNASYVSTTYLIAILTISTFAWLAKNRLNKGLNKIPGPYLASLTNWWRLYYVLVGRRQDQVQHRLHKQHGDVVRYGPNIVSFADPKAIKDIYGIGKPLTKVCLICKYLAGYFSRLTSRSVEILSPFASHESRPCHASALHHARKQASRSAEAHPYQYF